LESPVSNKYYELYVENVLKLAETIVIRFENSAVAENDWIIKNYGASYVFYVEFVVFITHRALKKY
jgi:hypothetical protein